MKKAIMILLLLASCAMRQTTDFENYSCPDCNVILISIDTFRGDHLTCAGYDKYAVNITKNICAIAAQGVYFTKAISQAPSTEASHASILTSALLSHHNAFNSRNQSISQEYPTLAEVLKESNYSTAGFTGSAQMSAIYGFDRGFDVFEEFRGEIFAEQAKRGIDWLNSTKGRKFLFLHTYEIHHPYTPDEKDAKQLDPDYKGSLGTNISVRFLTDINKGIHNITDEDLKHIIAMYDAEILSVDRAFGNFTEQLKTIGLHKNTIIILVSDHGEEFGEHGKVGWHSHTLYNELLHVPLIIAAPGLKPAVNNKLVMNLDVAPTLLNMLDIPLPKTYEGQSLDLGHEYAISEKDKNWTTPFAVQSTEMKYFKTEEQALLFNLTGDTAEKENIIGQQPAIAEKLVAIYNAANKTESKIKRANISETLREHLESLGYVE